MLMNTLRTERAKEILSSLTGRKLVAGTAAAAMALGLSGCGADNKELNGFEYGDKVALERVWYNDRTGNVQADFVPSSTATPASREDMQGDVHCGTYGSNFNASSVWEDGNGVSCHIKTSSGDRNSVIAEIEGVGSQVAGESYSVDGTSSEPESDPYTLGVGVVPE